MMGSLRAGVGHASGDDGRAAGRDAYLDAVATLDMEPTLVYVFASSVYETTAVYEGIADETAAAIAGCTTAGEIVGTSSHTESVAVLALAGDGLAAAIGEAAYGEQPRTSAARATADALSGLGDRLPTDVLLDEKSRWASYPSLVTTVFGDYDTATEEIVAGVTDVLGDATIHGGLAADDWKYDGSARTIADGVIERGVSVTAIQIDVKSGVGVRHGIDATDTAFEITDIEGDTITELDGRPALDVYEEALGPQVHNDQFRITAPLGFDVGDDEQRIHVAYAIDEDERTLSMTGGALLSTGDVGRLMDPDGADVIQGASEAVEAALDAAGNPDDIAAVMIHDCLCRWFFLSDTESRERELDVVRDRVGGDVPIVGWYTAGEIRLPDTLDGTYDQTMVVWILTNESL